jgi:hypothetical protein
VGNGKYRNTFELEGDNLKECSRLSDPGNDQNQMRQTVKKYGRWQGLTNPGPISKQMSDQGYPFANWHALNCLLKCNIFVITFCKSLTFSRKQKICENSHFSKMNKTVFVATLFLDRNFCALACTFNFKKTYLGCLGYDPNHTSEN